MKGVSDETRAWLERSGFTVRDEALWREALTHGSRGEERDYQRLEFLGDRVLGLAIAEWLFARNRGAEGKLAQRLNALVSKTACAQVARDLGAAEHIRIGRQAREEGAQHGDNVLGDVMEALLGANLREAGFDASRDLVRTLWRDQVEGSAGKAKHPKSALQEWAAAKNHPAPQYRIADRSGPDHRSSFTVEVEVEGVGTASATAGSKGEAEKLAAQAFMEAHK